MTTQSKHHDLLRIFLTAPFTQKTQHFLFFFNVLEGLDQEDRLTLFAYFLENFSKQIFVISRTQVNDTLDIQEDEIEEQEYERIKGRLENTVAKLLDRIIALNCDSIRASLLIMDFLAPYSKIEKAVIMVLIFFSSFCPYVWDFLPYQEPRENGIFDDVNAYFNGIQGDAQSKEASLIMAVVDLLSKDHFTGPNMIDTVLTLLLKESGTRNAEEEWTRKRAIMALFAHKLRHSPCDCIQATQKLVEVMKKGIGFLNNITAANLN